MAHKRSSVTTIEKRLLSEAEAREYIGLGKGSCREYCSQIGAVRRIGRRVLYDRVVIDRAIDDMNSKAARNQA